MKKNRSFTLIEMLVVIFILILLVSIVVIVFQRGNFEAKQNDNQRKKEIAELATAIEAFKADKGHYPLINWGQQLGINGVHAYSLLDYSCGWGGTYGTHYSPIARDCKFDATSHPECSLSDYDGFDPGTEIIYETDHYCDDLSLQLLGKAYLPKMPPDSNISQDLWVIPGRPGDSSLKPYLDEISNDPQLSKDWSYQHVCMTNCPTGAHPTTDYNPVVGTNIFRYLYNSYYQCSLEGIWVGDRYWLNAITQLKENGDYDNPTDPSLNGTGLYIYELGNANWFRSPRSSCH